MGQGKPPARKRSTRKKLPIKRQRFVEALLGPARGNKTEAARLAGYQVPKQEGHRLLTFADVSAEVQTRLDRMTQAMGADEIIERLSGIARADMTPFYEQVEVEVQWSELEKAAIEKARAEAQAKGETFEEPPLRRRKRAYLDVGLALENGMGWLLKSHSEGKYGANVGIHDSHAALVDLAKIRGILKQTAPPPPPTTLNLTLALKDLPEDALEAFVTALSKNRAIPVEATPKA